MAKIENAARAATLTLVATLAADVARAQLTVPIESAKLLASDGAANDFFGGSAALSGERALVGVSSDDTAAGLDAGSAYLYERQSDGSWLEIAKLTAGDGFARDRFGASVALAGERALVGAYRADTAAGANAGAAYVFERQGDGTWLEVAKLTASDAAADDELGISVSLSGERALLGANRADTAAGADAGAAYVFERQGDGTWPEVAKLTAGDGAAGDWLGQDVSLSADRALLGAFMDDTPAGSTGSAYLFERQRDGTWMEVAQLVPLDAANGDAFGASVALSGERALVGAPFSNGSDIGSAYVFERQRDGTWQEFANLTPSDGIHDDWFGITAAIEGDRALVGAATTLVLGFRGGAAYLYEREPDGSWPERAILEASDAQSVDHFGGSLSLSGDRALFGAPGDNAGTTPDVGSAYVFRFCDGCLEAFGSGSPGCNGPHEPWASQPPEIGMAAFAITCDDAPPSSAGFLVLGTAAHVAGFDPLGLGVLLHVDVFASAFLLSLPMPSDATGRGTTALALPGDPTLVGATLVAQAFWLWTSCALPPSNLSSSPGLSLTFLAP